MNSTYDSTGRRRAKFACVFVGLTLTLTFFATGAAAQTQPSDAKPADPPPAEQKPSAETYETLYLSNMTQQNDLNDILTDLRNILPPKAHVYGTPSQHAISIRANPEDILLAKKILLDMDRAKKAYRLTYTITEMDNGKRVGTQHLSLIAFSGEKTDLKQGNRVPLVTGTYGAGSSAQNSQVQYIDVGLGIEATLDGYADGVRLRTKIEQSSLAEEKSGVGVQDPVIRQTMLDTIATLVQGKPLVLGSLDIPGGTRHLDVEVVSELVK
jgi:type II secretory pathway component GspD/PulD (secretin)